MALLVVRGQLLPRALGVFVLLVVQLNMGLQLVKTCHLLSSKARASAARL